MNSKVSSCNGTTVTTFDRTSKNVCIRRLKIVEFPIYGKVEMTLTATPEEVKAITEWIQGECKDRLVLQKSNITREVRE